MEFDKRFLEALKNACGATNCAQVFVKDIVLDAGLRQNCEMNYCGEYGRTWVCPPHCGTIESCMAKVLNYRQAAVIQTISPLEDSYDIEGMEEAAKSFGDVFARAVRFVQECRAALGEERLEEKDVSDTDQTPASETNGVPEFLFLAAGGCHRCEQCAIVTNAPCRRPDEAFASLESHGIFVSDLAQKAGLNYINGQNTVTYFGAIFSK